MILSSIFFCLLASPSIMNRKHAPVAPGELNPAPTFHLSRCAQGGQLAAPVNKARSRAHYDALAAESKSETRARIGTPS